ncbi:MalY/PatB family protein [uncultured Trichococcus sp.]|uniref:MalY/PatB family protein n=1 Tax=uncultured Trichococcus sp. TaxID=189665 RepID=UPI0029C9A757|nr:MalY/PatB family protein [uncultured Trichococcus sp.]
MDFNQSISRINTGSVKWDMVESVYGSKDLLPLWIADMDFMVSPKIIEAIEKETSKGVFGYKSPSESLKKAIINWQSKQHNYQPDSSSIIFSPAVVPSICTAIQTYSEEEEAVLIHDPVYPPFASSVLNNNRELVTSSLVYNDGEYSIDFDDVEEKMMTREIKMYIFCNPHNPGGRVWKYEELKEVVALCKKYDVVLISDEIHQDIVFKPNKFTSMLTIDGSEDFTIALTAPTKTFNLAGLKCSYAFIPNQSLRERFVQTQAKNSGPDLHLEMNSIGLTATEIALNNGELWLQQVIQHFDEQFDIVEEFLKNEIPNLKFKKPEGTYLAWLDFSELGLDDEQLMDLLVNEGKVALNAGCAYGEGGSRFMRLNIATSRERLLEGLNRIKKSVYHIDNKIAL